MPRLAIVVGVGLLAVGASTASASRPATKSERAQITRAVLLGLERDSFARPSPELKIYVQGFRVSLIVPGTPSPYKTLAFFTVSTVDPFGNHIGDDAYGLVGLSRRYRSWTLLSYGSSDVGCDHNEAIWFGGKRAAILRDLGLLPCPR